MPDDTDVPEFDSEEDLLSYILLEAKVGDCIRLCRGEPLCDGSLALDCKFCHRHVKRGDETIYELMVAAYDVTVH